MNKTMPIIIMLLLSSCSTCKIAKQSSIREIQFGNGGGFTGAVTTYCLKADGSLYKQEQLIKRLTCDSLCTIYELAEQLPQEDFIHPGNTYSFIRLVAYDTLHYYQWTLENKPNENIVELYLKLSKQL